MAEWNPFKKKDESVPDPKTTPDNTEALLAKMGELLNPFKESIDDFKKSVDARFTAVEEGIKPKAPVVDPKPTDPASVFDDENAAFNQRLGPLAIQQAELRARMIERDIFDENEQWSEFFPEIKKQLANTHITVKASPTYDVYVRNVFNMVIGEAARTTGGLKRNGQRFVLEDGAGSGNKEADRVSQEDRAFLDFHVTTSKGKVVTRREFLTRMGVDVADPKQLAEAKKNYEQLQVVN
jgi:hypothetical protein